MFFSKAMDRDKSKLKSTKMQKANPCNKNDIKPINSGVFPLSTSRLLISLIMLFQVASSQIGKETMSNREQVTMTTTLEANSAKKKKKKKKKTLVSYHKDEK